MAETILNSALAVSRWRKDYFRDYVRASRFRPYMGAGKMNIIIVMRDLLSAAGQTVNIPFISGLTGSGVSGSQVLVGNEEELVTANMPIAVDWRRNGVVVPKSEQYKTEIDLLDAAREELKAWESNMLRADIIREFGAILTSAGVSIPYASASEAEKDAWLALNSDRVLFGKDVSNNSGNDHSASLANIDTTNDKATAALVTKAKRRMKAAKITPYQVEDGREFFVLFAGSRAFRDLSEDATILAANTNARERNVDTNPIFQGGDLIYQGVIIREEEEIAVLSGVGNGGADVEPMYMTGAAAVGIAWGQEPLPKTDRDRDYGFRPGVAIEELVGTKKINESGVQRGVHTIYVAAPADA